MPVILPFEGLRIGVRHDPQSYLNHARNFLLIQDYERDPMCFSAQASFIGAAALTVIGTATVKLPLPKKDKLWTCLPLLFAFQQFCEGIVWLDLRGNDPPYLALTVLAKDLYLFFALALWLVFFPLAFLIGETDSKRKSIMKAVLAFGILIACINFTSYPILDLSPTIQGYSIHYLTEAVLWKRICYLAIIVLPPFLSSIKHMKIFGMMAAISCVIAEYFYLATFTSVWCFLGSFVSAGLYLIARTNVINEQMQKQEQTINKNSLPK